MREAWTSGDAYEAYVGRWSRLVAAAFVPWLQVPPHASWLDVGCGTGALTETALARAGPVTVLGVDRSRPFAAAAGARATDERCAFVVGDAVSLPVADRSFDASVSGLVLNFVGEPGRAVAELVRVTRPGGRVGAYVWDYAEGMAMMRQFWDVVAELDPASAVLDEQLRFAMCRPEPLRRLWIDSGLVDVRVRPIEVPTVFHDFDDYWQPFLGGQGAAPAYVGSLAAHARHELREALRSRLSPAPGGTISLTARAWAVQGAKAR